MCETLFEFASKLELIQVEHIVFNVTILEMKAGSLVSLQGRAYVQWQVEGPNQAQTCLLSPSLLTVTFLYVAKA